MTVQQGPEVCKEYMPYDGSGFSVCFGTLPCSRNHASTRQVADKFDAWATNRAYANIWLNFEMGHDPKDIKSHIGDILGLNMTREESDAHVRNLMEGIE